RLAHLVATHPSTEGKPNIMAVGDDDQSIFAFNGAELNNMLTFRRTYEGTKTIVLSENYRSTQYVLDTAQSVIEQADDRLVKREADLTKLLQAQSDVKPGDIKHLQFPTRQHELEEIAKRVQQTWQDRGEDSIAILARNHDSLREMSAQLIKLGVPIQYEQQNNVLDHPLIQQISLLAEIVCAIAGGNEDTVNHGLAVLLQHEVWQVSDKQLWKLATDNSTKPHWLESLLEHDDESLVMMAQWLLWLSRQSNKESLAVMLDYLIGFRAGTHMTSPLREYFLALRPIDNTYLIGLSGLQVLRGATGEFVAASGRTQLSDFVRFLQLHKELQRPITDESWFASGDQAVQLMTVHKAKGLEFGTVFLLEATEDNWKPRHIGRKPPANLPLQPYGEQYDDYVRLLYVAATRAKHSLIISSYANDGQGRPLLPTPLITSVPMEVVKANPAESIVALEASLGWPRLDPGDERAMLKARLQDYKLSPTALLQFLDVTTGGPQRFLERQLLRLPEVTTPTMAFGTAIHRSLQVGQQLTNKGRFSLQDVIESYESTLELQPMTNSDFKRYLEHGTKTINNLFEKNGYKLLEGGQPEIGISDIDFFGARVTGKLDLINADKDEVIITDYKTGKPLTNFTTRDQTKAVKAWRHRTQLLFYILLTQHSGRYKAAKTYKSRMLYVEAETPSELSLELEATPEELERTRRLISVVWQYVCDLKFPDVRHYKESVEGILTFEDDLLNGKI
ncbi:MAG: 3'-5' exonuclease, partial [Candidatus Saccharimonadales bacterium]